MLENEFEDEIRRKLDSLRLTPSADVWSRVEDEIRGPKKRRFAFWMPIAALLLLGVGTFALWPFGDETDSATANNVKNTEQSVLIPEPATAEKNIPSAQPVSPANTESLAVTEPGKSAPSQKSFNGNTPPIAQTIRATRSTVKRYESIDNQVGKPELDSNSEIAGIIAEKTSNLNRAEAHKDDKVDKVDQAIAVTSPDIKPVHNDIIAKASDSSQTAVNTIKPQASGIDSARSTNIKQAIDLSAQLAATNPVQKKKAKSSKLLFSAYAGSGASWPGHSFKEGELQPDLASSTSLTAPGYAIRPSINSSDRMPTPVNPIAAEPGAHMAFSTGLGLQKFITRHFAVSTGVGYNLVASEYQTGDFVKADNNVMTTRESERVQDYFKNGTTQKYINRYHFAEIPLEANFIINPAAKVRFGIDAGASLQYMFALNALHFSKVDFIYYQNDDLFNRTQVALNTGLNLQFNAWKGMPLKMGPVFRYHVSNNRDKGILASEHPSYLGLRLGVVFN